MSDTIQVDFGPGRFESLHLQRTGQYGHLYGTYMVYAGCGWEHTAEIDIEEAFDYLLGDREMAEELLAFALEDWTDPCEEVEE